MAGGGYEVAELAMVCCLTGALDRGAGYSLNDLIGHRLLACAASQIVTFSCLTCQVVCLSSGSGAYSEVYQVTRKCDGVVYALKQVKI